MPFKRIEDGIEDTEGNMPLKRVVEDGVEQNDAEGHGLKKFHLEDGVAGDDAEGNAFRHVADGVDDDTEGNKKNFR